MHCFHSVSLSVKSPKTVILGVFYLTFFCIFILDKISIFAKNKNNNYEKTHLNKETHKSRKAYKVCHGRQKYLKGKTRVSSYQTVKRRAGLSINS